MADESKHIVSSGETLASIAHQYGFSDWKKIYDYAKNKDFKNKRANPNILYPGDEIVIPKKGFKEESVDTEKPFTIKIGKQKQVVRVVLKDSKGKPFAKRKYSILVGEQSFDDETDDAGLVKRELPPETKELTLSLSGKEKGAPPDFVWRLKIGHLDPVEEFSGQKARLNNLGYRAGDATSSDDPQFLSALEEFQCNAKLKVDGASGPKTQSKLKELHGC